MNRIVMRVYRKYYQNGSPWKDWCVAEEGNRVKVRFGGTGKRLQERLLLPEKTLWSVIAEQEKSGYKFLGTYNVSTVIEDEANAANATLAQLASAPVMPQQAVQAKVIRYLSWTAKLISKDWEEKASELLENFTPELDWEVELKGNTRSLVMISGTERMFITIDEFGNGRGRLAYTDNYAFVVALLALSKTLPLTVADEKAEIVQAFRMRANHELFNIDGNDRDQVIQLAQRVGLLIGSEQRKMAGSAAFF